MPSMNSQPEGSGWALRNSVEKSITLGTRRKPINTASEAINNRASPIFPSFCLVQHIYCALDGAKLLNDVDEHEQTDAGEGDG